MSDPVSAPAVESLTADHAAAEFATMRDNPDLYHPERPGYAAATARMNALDLRLRAGSEPRALGGASPQTFPAVESPLEVLNRRAAEASAVTLAWSDGQAVDKDAEAALRSLVVTHDVVPTELPTFLTEAAAAQGRAGLDAESRLAARDDVLVELFGEHADLWIDRAATVLAALPAPLHDYLREYRMLEDAWVWVRAAARWEEMHQ